MYNFGNTNNHGNAIRFGNLAALDNPSAYSLAMVLEVTTGGNQMLIFGKGDYSSATTGWFLELITGPKIGIAHGNTTYVQATANSTNLPSGKNLIVVTWDGSNVDYYVNRVADGTPAFAITANTNVSEVKLGGNQPNTATFGAAVNISNAMWWDVALTAEEAAGWPEQIPRMDSLQFWAPGYTDPGAEFMGQATVTKAGTVTIIEDSINWPGFEDEEESFNYSSMVKVVNEDEEVVDVLVNLLGLLEVIDETLQISEGTLNILGMLRVVSETLQVQDGDNHDLFDPFGKLTETMSDGTVWTQIFPPFIKRTQWN